jgi:RNA polymerase sigma-70 factor (ECF subfamily)
MDENSWLAERFEENRTHLRAVAYRMLGSLSEADDAVQDAWLRLSRAESSDIENLRGWLTTVVGRVCLDMLRARKSRREEPLSAEAGEEPVASRDSGIDPEQEALMAEAVGLAMLVVIDRLAPAERLAFVLHDMFAVPFDEIAPIVGRSSVTVRQLASRARRRVQGTGTDASASRSEQRQAVEAFLAASRGGDFDALLAVLDPDVEFQGDPAATHLRGPKDFRGARVVAKLFSGRAQAARAALVNGEAAMVVAPLGKLFLVLVPTVVNGRIMKIEVIAEPERLRTLDLAVLSD